MLAVHQHPIDARPRESPRHVRAGDHLPAAHAGPFSLVESDFQLTRRLHRGGGRRHGYAIGSLARPDDESMSIPLDWKGRLEGAKEGGYPHRQEDEIGERMDVRGYVCMCVGG